MTKNEARKLAADARSIASCMTYNGSATESAAKWRLYELAIALETKESEPPSIAQSIRNAAINWPQFVDDWTSEILHGADDHAGDWSLGLLPGMPEHENFTSRTFMLFVAEALE